MNKEEYREQIRREVEEELARQPAAEAGGDLASIVLEAPSADGNIDRLLQVLGDRNESADARLRALQALQQLAFDVPLFAQFRPAFIETLRQVIDDPDPRLRETALETLAQERDEYVQRRLLAGLERAEEPLVSDDKAIQFLGYDIHAEHFPTIRRLAQEAPDPATRSEAVKLLSADTESAGLLMEIFDNKGEDADVRRASASALMSVDPLRFEQRAKEAVVDESDAESVRAATLTALTYFGNPTALAGDTEFVERLSKVDTRPMDLESPLAGQGGEEEGQLAKAVRLFQSRHGGR